MLVINCLKFRNFKFAKIIMPCASAIQNHKIFDTKKVLFSTSSRQCKIHRTYFDDFDIWIEQAHRKVPHEEPIPDKTNMEVLMKGFKLLPNEIKKAKDEFVEDVKHDKLSYKTGDLLKLFDFSKEEGVQSFITSSDSSYDVGFSNADFTSSSNNSGVFSGFVNLKLPGDGITRSTGYCNITSKPKMLSYLRQTSYKDLRYFSHLVIRCRGDGRTYLILLDMSENWDVTWGNKHFYYLHTRGGPHWQTTFIPFTSFIRQNRGFVQDVQFPVFAHCVKGFGFTVANIEGPFRLELDYIGVYKDAVEPIYPYELYPNRNPFN